MRRRADQASEDLGGGGQIRGYGSLEPNPRSATGVKLPAGIRALTKGGLQGFGPVSSSVVAYVPTYRVLRNLPNSKLPGFGYLIPAHVRG